MAHIRMPDKASKLVEEIKRTMEHAEDWEKKKTSIPGIFLVKMPDRELRVMLMFNPLDEQGVPTKRKGFYFGSAETVQAARAAFPDPRLDDLVSAVEKLNGASGRKRPSDEDVFEV